MDTGQSVTDIDIDQFFFYFDKTNRKRIEKAYNNVKFESILLTKNDMTGQKNQDEFPFENSKRDIKLH